MEPIVQIAIDVTENNQAAHLAACALAAGADWLEIGNPLVKFEGVHAISHVSSRFPDAYILVDFMILAGAKRYITAARERGARNVTVTALAPDITVRETIEEGKRQGIAVTVDLFNVPSVVESAKKYEAMGADYIMVHFGTDQKRERPDFSPLAELKAVSEAVRTPLSYAVYDQAEGVAAVQNGASIIVVGQPLIAAADPTAAIAAFVQAIKQAKENAPC